MPATESLTTLSAVPSDPGDTAAQPRYRSGVVARMAGMPVSTLRVWEQRYRVILPVTTASGQRLYSEADVYRLTLLRQLTECGHAIGTIAALEIEHLQRMAALRPDPGGAPTTAGAVTATWRVAVVGKQLAKRLARLQASWTGSRTLEVVARFGNLVDVGAGRSGEPVDLLLVGVPGLHGDLLDPLQVAARAAGALQSAVLYGFTSSTARSQLDAAGVALLREPRTDAALLAWLQSLSAGSGHPPAIPDMSRRAKAASPAVQPLADEFAWLRGGVIPQRRYDDETLSGIAAAAASVACECPRHVAELLIQLSNFETYSAECESRNAADAQLHAYLHRVAGMCRALHEEALARVASHESLSLPS